MTRLVRSEKHQPQEQLPVVRVGRVRVKGQGSLSGWAWRAKSLVLTDEALLIPGNKIPLKHITKVERVDLKPYCLLLQVQDKAFHLSFENDGELYDWQDDVYSRCPLIGVGNPHSFTHNVHVGFDEISGNFSGLPNQWNGLVSPGSATAVATTTEPEKVYLDGKRSSVATSPLHDTPALGYRASTIQNRGRPKSPTIMNGLLSVKVGGFFTGWRWQPRWLVLRPKTLTIYRSQRASVGIVIDLNEITSVDIVKTRRLRLETKSGKRYFISFRVAEQAHAWHQAISPVSEISHPWNFVHNYHVGFDAATGAFTGLPNEWRHLVEHPSVAQPSTH